jgi:striatin 1/3/4
MLQSKEGIQTGKKVWKSKCTLKSHMDGVRGLYFSESQDVLVSASEDGSLKVWDMETNDPYVSLRGH